MMKKTVFCLLLLIFISASLKAQLANSKWKGVLKLENPMNVVFNFGKDTLTVLNVDDNSVVETMTYTFTNSTFTLVKISGQSECDSSTPGKYKYQIKDAALTMTVIEDTCEDRAVLNNLQLNKNAQ